MGCPPASLGDRRSLPAYERIADQYEFEKVLKHNSVSKYDNEENSQNLVRSALTAITVRIPFEFLRLLRLRIDNRDART